MLAGRASTMRTLPPMDTDPRAQLGAIFDELVTLVQEAKQAEWTATSPERRQQLNRLKQFLGEQLQRVDDAERRIGTRLSSIASPTGHAPRNLAVEAGGDTDRILALLVGDLRVVSDDVRRRAGALGGEWQPFLLELAAAIEGHVDGL